VAEKGGEMIITLNKIYYPEQVHHLEEPNGITSDGQLIIKATPIKEVARMEEVMPITITNEHSASSYGIPAILIAGEIFSPHDKMPIPANASQMERDLLPFLEESVEIAILHRIHNNPKLTEQEKDFIRRAL
jgi:hypothetical protein